MLNIALEDMPSEVIVQIMRCLPGYRDLYAMIISSAIFYSLFKTYESSILKKIALNILGPENWSNATAVLVYQRKHNRISESTVNKDLESEFVLTKEDITQLLINQRSFESCASDFKNTLSLYPGCTGDHHHIPQGTIKHSFTTEDTLSMEVFYKMWLLGLQFDYDSIITFSNRAAYSKQDAADFNFISQIIYQNESYVDVAKLPAWGCGFPKGGLECVFTMFKLMGDCIMERDVHNPLLLLKAMYHFAVSSIKPPNKVLRASLKLFLLDYLKMSIGDLVEKYKLEG